jgi:hypothetical protein
MIIFVSLSSLIFKNLHHKVFLVSPEISKRFFNHQDLGFSFVFDPVSSDLSISHLWKYIEIIRLFIILFFIVTSSIFITATFISLSFFNITWYSFIYLIFIIFLGIKTIINEKNISINKNLIFYLSDATGIIILICFAIQLLLNDFYDRKIFNLFSIVYNFSLVLLFLKKLYPNPKKSTREIVNNSAVILWLFTAFIIIAHIISIAYLIRYLYVIKDYNHFLIIALVCLVIFSFMLEFILIPFLRGKKYYSIRFLEDKLVKFCIIYPFRKITKICINHEIEPAQILTSESEINNRIYFSVVVYLDNELEIILAQGYYYRLCEEICNHFNRLLYEK